MPYYDLQIVNQQRSLSTPAEDRDEALAIFGRQLGQKLSLEDSDAVVAVYLLGESEVSLHYVNPTIRVFATATP